MRPATTTLLAATVDLLLGAGSGPARVAEVAAAVLSWLEPVAALPLAGHGRRVDGLTRSESGQTGRRTWASIPEAARARRRGAFELLGGSARVLSAFGGFSGG